MTKGAAVVVGLALGFGFALTAKFIRHAPEITVAWGNAWAERERRIAAEAPIRAEAEKAAAERRAADEARRAADETHNEAHCKVTVSRGLGSSEVISGARRISRTRSGYSLHFGGGVSRYVGTVLKTENCR